MFEKLALNKLFQSLDDLETGSLSITTPDGEIRHFSGKHPGENVEIELRDWRVITNMVSKGHIGFVEDYQAGHWETNDLIALITLGMANRNAFDHFIMGNHFSRIISALSYLLRLNSVQGSKKNIHAHYDLGNHFYKLWLDPSMTYSSAIFQNDNDTLEQAQYNKYDRILSCLNKNSGSLLEVGCGWGGFAERAQSNGDFEIKGVTLSEEQHAYATNRLAQKANIALEDYRHQDGKFDNIVSIEMFEAVGERYWPTYFKKVGQLLNKNGKAVIQTITMNEQDFPRYRRSGDFIRSYIFPGGMLPSPSRFESEAQKMGLKASNDFYFGQDYARTLTEWLHIFDKKTQEIKKLGFDDRFIRLWRFYLAGCIAGFKTGCTDVMQVELSHAS